MFDELADGVYRRRYESLDLNIGVVIGEEGVLLIDTRASHRQARELLGDLASLTDLPVRWVVNTHWHWDHTFGNAIFEHAEIWGHELTRIGMQQNGETMRGDAKEWLTEEQHPEIDEVRVVPPGRVFSEEASLRIGREVRLTYHGLAHTDSDIVVRLPGTDVAFFGDLVEEGAPPAFSDSHPIAWPLTLRLAAEGIAGIVVPGHGDVVGPDYVRAMVGELGSVADLATRVIDDELALEDAVGRGPYPEETMRVALGRAQSTSG